MLEFLAGLACAKLFLGGGRDEPEPEPALVSIEADRHVAVTVILDCRAEVGFSVKSSAPVDVHFVSAEGLKAFRTNRDFSALSTTRDATSAQDAFTVAPGRYILLIVNWNKKKTVSACYGVWSRP